MGNKNSIHKYTINFFTPQCRRENICEVTFGICDDEDDSVKTPAYISTNPTDKWIAIVQNHTGKPLNFTAVDNCIEIRRANGEMDNRCDAILTNDEHIVFIELKVQQTSGWIAHAVDEQLQTTVDHFKANCDIDKYRYRRAFVCNRKFPLFNVSNKERMNAFYKKNRIRLSIEQTIEFK